MSIVDKLTYLDTTKQLLKTEINKINNVLDDNSTFRSYPQELFNGYLDILNNGTDTLWNNLEKVSQTGTEAVLEGVETAPIKMVLNGNTSQDGTPTPDTPVEVKVVKGENVVSVQGKNLLNSATIVNGYVDTDGTVGASSVSKRSDYIKVSSETQYTISFKYETVQNVQNRRIAFYDDSKNFISYISYNVVLKARTFTAPSGTAYLIVAVPIESYDIQLEEGSTVTDFVPYSKTDYPISLGTIELCKIGNYKDYLFKRNGKWYVHKEIGKINLKDTIDGNWAIAYSGTENYFYRYRSIEDVNLNFLSCISNYFKNVNIGSTNTVEGITIVSGNKELRIRFGTQMAIADFKTWLTTYTPVVYYVLATPTEEEITNTTLIEQLEAISNAKSVKDKTYITQTNEELPFILDVEAIKEYSVE